MISLSLSLFLSLVDINESCSSRLVTFREIFFYWKELLLAKSVLLKLIIMLLIIITNIRGWHNCTKIIDNLH